MFHPDSASISICLTHSLNQPGYTGTTGYQNFFNIPVALYGNFDIEVSGITFSSSNNVDSVIAVHCNQWTFKNGPSNKDLIFATVPTVQYHPFIFKANGVNINGFLEFSLYDLLQSNPYINSQAIYGMNYLTFNICATPSKSFINNQFI